MAVDACACARVCYDRNRATVDFRVPVQCGSLSLVGSDRERGAECLVQSSRLSGHTACLSQLSEQTVKSLCK